MLSESCVLTRGSLFRIRVNHTIINSCFLDDRHPQGYSFNTSLTSNSLNGIKNTKHNSLISLRPCHICYTSGVILNRIHIDSQSSTWDVNMGIVHNRQGHWIRAPLIWPFIQKFKSSCRNPEPAAQELLWSQRGTRQRQDLAPPDMWYICKSRMIDLILWYPPRIQAQHAQQRSICLSQSRSQ